MARSAGVLVNTTMSVLRRWHLVKRLKLSEPHLVT